MPALRRLTDSLVLRRASGGPEAEGGLRIVPFVPGWRPTDEATHPGLGSSDQAALILGRPPSENAAYVLFSAPAGAPVDVTLSVGAEIVWDRRPLPLRCFGED